MDTDGVFLCEDVSQIEFKNGLFYLTDICGDVCIKRAMRPSTFFKCVAGAARIIDQFERTNSEVAGMFGH